MVPNLKFSLDAAHNRPTDGGWAREVTVRELPVATEMAGVDMRLKPRAGRVPGATNMVFLPLGGGQRRGLDHGCEFLLVFDDGYFSENKTFLLTQGTVPHSFKVRLAD